MRFSFGSCFGRLGAGSGPGLADGVSSSSPFVRSTTPGGEGGWVAGALAAMAEIDRKYAWRLGL